MDADGSGFIDYSEFCVAAIDKKKLLSDKKIRQAFALFDHDNGGTIDSHELKRQLFNDMEIDDDHWDAIINEIDQDGNGEIDPDEFSYILKKLMEEGEDEDKEPLILKSSNSNSGLTDWIIINAK